MSRKIVGGRIEEGLDKEVLEFLSGNDIIYDTELISHDIFGNIAHILMLNKVGAIPDNEVGQILAVLKEIYIKWYEGEFELSPELEDVHMNIEHAIIEKVGGEIGGKVHLARSRNDQILVDLHLFMKEEIINIQKVLVDLLQNLIKMAEENLNTLYIGYTHLQQAQPITFAHWCMAHVDTLFRDLERLTETLQRVNVNPLGAGAIAGTSWPIDREYTTELLGFDRVQENTLDVISSRGEFEAELVGNINFIMIHLGRMAEDVILGTTSEFGFFTLSDKYSTGSSIMPQKKNPDVAELIRAKAGIVNGYLTQIFGILKGLPSGYNRDHQDLKEPLFNSIEIGKMSIHVLTGLLSTMKLNKDKIESQMQDNFIIATELVDLLIKEYKIPFRTAYTIIGNLVKDFHQQNDKKPSQITAEILMKYVEKSASQKILVAEEKIKKAIDPLETIKRRSHIGGPAPQEVQRMIKSRKSKLESEKSKILENDHKIDEIYKNLIIIAEKKITG